MTLRSSTLSPGLTRKVEFGFRLLCMNKRGQVLYFDILNAKK